VTNLWGKPEKNEAASPMEEKEWGHYQSREARSRDLKHLEMAYEWLRKRRKAVPLKRPIENL
jgi:hypothetical protein